MSDVRHAVVTGGSGFIGSHTCERLLDAGYHVRCLDNFATSSAENVAHLAGRAGFEMIEHDITTPLDLAGEVELVIHMASLPSPVDYVERPVETLRVGSVGTLNVLDLARAKGARCLYASSSEVYGAPDVHPQVETYHGNVNPSGARSCYNEGKRFGEAVCRAYRDLHDVDTVIVRIFNTYGPRMRLADGRLVPTFIQQALTNRPITVHGLGEQTRSLCYVDDMVTALLKAAESDTPGPINVGNPYEQTVVAIARLICELCRSDSPIEYGEAREEDPTRRCPDIERARRELFWEPEVDVRTGLAATIAWFAESVALPAGGRS
jgi:nucleoside-diphosphate-sugar epimerase